MNKKIILHIGQSKSASTFIQENLFFNKTNLIKKKTLYPKYNYKSIKFDALNHNSYALSLNDEGIFPKIENYKIIENNFLKEMEKNNCETLILSSENFFGVPRAYMYDNKEEFIENYKKKLIKLSQFTKKFQATELILFKRELKEWVHKIIEHQIKIKYLHSKNNIIPYGTILERMLNYINYDELLNLWKEIILPSKFHIINYDKNCSINKIIFDILDLKLADFNFKNKSINRGWDINVSYYKEIRNKKHKSKNQERALIYFLNKYNNKLKKIISFDFILNKEDLISKKTNFYHSDEILILLKKYTDEHTLKKLDQYMNRNYFNYKILIFIEIV